MAVFHLILYMYKNNTGIDKHRKAAWYTSDARRRIMGSDVIKKTLLTPMRQSKTCKTRQLQGSGDSTSDVAPVGSVNEEGSHYMEYIPWESLEYFPTHIAKTLGNVVIQWVSTHYPRMIYFLANWLNWCIKATCYWHSAWRDQLMALPLAKKNP